MGKYFLIAISLIIVTSANVSAQNELTIDSINKTMEVMFENNDWYAIINYGESALRKGYEFFFLRARLGIAYFETGDYFNSIKHLEKSLDIGFENPTVLEYLYYAYSYAGRTEDKNYAFKLLPDNLKKRIKPLVNQMADNLHTEFGGQTTNDIDRNSSVDPDGINDLFGEQTLNGNGLYINVGLNQIPFKMLNISYDYSYIKLQKTKQIEFNNEYISNDYDEYQNRFYNSINFRAAPGFIISPAWTYLSKKYTTVYADYDSVSTAPPDSGQYFYTISESETLYSDFVLSLDISKNISIYKFGINGSFSYLNKSHQSQIGMTFKIFPLKNVKLYSNTNLFLQNQNDITNLIFDQTIGGLLNKTFKYEAFVTIGNINNFNDRNGFRVYYNPDVIKYILGLEVNYSITKNFRAKLAYSYQNRKRFYTTYIPDNDFINTSSYTPTQNELLYDVNNILFGLNYDF